MIGPGGGSDVLVALASGSPEVTAVEMNPLMLRFVRHFGPRPETSTTTRRCETILSEGRNFLSRTDRSVRRDLPGLRGLVGRGGVGRPLALGELPLHDRGVPRLLRPPHRRTASLVIMRWRDDIPRLVSNAVALLGAEEARGASWW